MKYLATVLSGAFLLSAAAVARPPEYPYHQVSTEVRTPHVAWATPLRNGPIRVLAVAPRFALRDVAELAQRLEMDYETVALWDSRHLGHDPALADQHVPGSSREEAAQCLGNFLKKPFDVIVLAHADLASLPFPQQEQIVRQVSEGVGLLLAHHRAGAPGPLASVLTGMEASGPGASLARGIGDIGLPGWSEGNARVRTGQHGEGRVVEFLYPGDAPRTHGLIPVAAEAAPGDLTKMDNAFSLVCRALLWAGRRDAPVRIASVTDATPAGPSEDEVPPGLPVSSVQTMRDSAMSQPTRPFVLTLDQPADRRYEVRVQPRRAASASRLSYTFDALLAKGAVSYRFDLLAGPGDYLLDVWIADRKGVADWYTQPITIQGWPEFTGLSLSKEELLPNDVLDLSLSVRGIFSNTRNCTIYARALDPFPRAGRQEGRLVAEAQDDVGSKGGRVRLRFNLADLIASSLKVEVFALEGKHSSFPETLLHSAFREYRYVPVRGRGDLRPPALTVVAETLSEPNMRHYVRGLADRGVEALCLPASAVAQNGAWSRFQLLPKIARYAPDAILDGSVREPCLTDLVYLDYERGRLQDMAPALSARSCGLYFVGEGNCLSHTDETVCRSVSCLEGLRRFLRKRYASLRELNTIWGTDFAAWEDVCPPATEYISCAAHLDFRAFMDETFARFHGAIRDAVRKFDLSAKTGFCLHPGDDPNLGYDLKALADSIDFLITEPGSPAALRLGSYARSSMSWGLAVGGAWLPGSVSHGRWLPWHAALQGAESLWLFRPYGFVNAPAAEPMLLPDGRLAQETQALFSACDELASGIRGLLLQATPAPADVAIYASRRNRHLDAAFPETGESSEEAVRQWVRLFDEWGYAYQFLKQTELSGASGRGHKVLLLPMARALDEGEVESILSFVEEGGRVLADARPGGLDGHGRRRAQPPLETLFRATVEQAGDNETTGGPRTQTPGMLTEPGQGQEEAIVGFLREAGCAPAVSFRKGNAPFQGKRFRLRFGKAEIYALLASPEAQEIQKGRLALPGDSQVYDMRTGETVRRPENTSFRLEPGDAALYAALPNAVEGIEVLVPERVAAGQRLTVRVGIQSEEGAPSGSHLVAVDLMPSGGAPLPHYHREIVCSHGAGQTYAPLALNETPGAYTVRVRDLLSGQEVESRLTILGVRTATK